jgi:hypothetical protein
MTPILFSCCLLLGFFLLRVPWGHIDRRATAARVLPGLYYAVCAIGFGLGLFGTPLVFLLLFERADWYRQLPPLLQAALLAALAWGAAFGGAWIGVGYLKMQTATDPDYGEGPAGRQRPSLEADVPEAREGDHLRPH